MPSLPVSDSFLRGDRPGGGILPRAFLRVRLWAAAVAAGPNGQRAGYDPVVPVAVPPPATATGSAPPALEVSYTAIPAAEGFTGQVTVVNRSSAAISGWRLIVALPGDSVSAVQNAEFTKDQGVLSMTPAPYDLSVAPGNGVTVSIYASGPVRTPTECTFNDVACR